MGKKRRFYNDVETVQEEYQKILKRLIKMQKLDDDLIMRARNYAFHLFFRRRIPVNL